jgi:uncharacterized protein (TIGR03435 family)
VNVPDWIRRERFDIIAQPPNGAAGQAMLRTLLVDRFRLQAAAGGAIVLNAQPLARLVAGLGMAVRRLVVDRTERHGLFDIRLRWSADVNVGAHAGDIPSVFTAVQEQLGLKLEPARGPVEVLVIESVERPTPD